MPREEKMYATIRNCMLGSYRGFSVEGFAFRENFLIKGIGRPDIVIAVDTGGLKIPDTEIWVVEVKKKSESILNSLTQSLKYSLFAHRCHLTVRFGKKADGFSDADIFLAESLRVGLIEFRYDNVKMVNFSKKFSPIPAKVNEVMEKLDFRKCNICGNYVNEEKICYEYPVNLFAAWTHKGKLQPRNIRYTKANQRTVDICEDCIIGITFIE